MVSVVVDDVQVAAMVMQRPDDVLVVAAMARHGDAVVVPLLR
jgi:hypothetical protein